jgi:hypothetical protein
MVFVATMLVPFLVSMVGLILYLATEGKISEAGRISFFTGLFWLVFLFAKSVVTF